MWKDINWIIKYVVKNGKHLEEGDTYLIEKFTDECHSKYKGRKLDGDDIDKQPDPAIVHTFKWQLYGHSGKLEARNMKEALHKVINFWSKLPYPDQKIARLDILCKKCVTAKGE